MSALSSFDTLLIAAAVAAAALLLLLLLLLQLLQLQRLPAVAAAADSLGNKCAIDWRDCLITVGILWQQHTSTLQHI